MKKKSGTKPADNKKIWKMPWWVVPLSFFLVELFAFSFLMEVDDVGVWEYLFAREETVLKEVNFWPLAFGALWAVLLGCISLVLPEKAGRWVYGISYLLLFSYAVVQTGYFLLFRKLMWISDFRYASEGSDYFSVLFQYPLTWWLGILALGVLGGVTVWKYPAFPRNWANRAVMVGLTLIMISGISSLPKMVFLHDKQVRYASSDYGRSQSREAAYTNMFDAHRLYEVCGLSQTLAKDFYADVVFPITPAYRAAASQAKEEIDAYFAQRTPAADNEFTGIFEGKNVVLVLMESMDDWMIGEHTPTINSLMDQGINFTNFYTPGYGGVRTFNSEFCLNTGSFLSSQGGYAFDYVTNDFRQSFAYQMRQAGYSAKVYHYNEPEFYSRGVFSPAMGYEEYVCYEDYVTEETEDDLYSDQFLFDYSQVADDFFRDGPRVNFIITRSAHLSYIYNEVLSYWGLKQYPQYRGLTGHEEEDCAYLKAKLVDDFFARLLQELEAEGQLENTVIIGVTDHYTYGYKDMESLLKLSNVEETILLEKTPCFIWSPGLEPMEMDKVLNTSDLLPTMLNLLGMESPYAYIGHDAFDASYDGFVPFSNGSWIQGDIAYDSATKKLISIDGAQQRVSAELQKKNAESVQEFIRINNLILESDYYK